LSKIPLWFSATRVGSLSSNNRHPRTSAFEGASILILQIKKLFNFLQR
jgi:hypothetical protein